MVKTATKTATKPARRKAPAKKPVAPLKAKTARTAKRSADKAPAIAPSTQVLYCLLDDLSVAPENPRAGRKGENIDALAANIAHYGILQPLVVYKAKDDRVMVVDGRRRLLALQKLNWGDVVPVVMRANEAAREVALAAGTQRENLHPADAAVAWADMLANGAAPKEIANAFGVTERFLQQRVKLASLDKPILAALKADKIGLAVAAAWANVPSDRRASLWKKLGSNADTYDISRAIEKGRVAGDDGRCKFIGEAAYEAAGGVIERDLFAFADDYDTDADVRAQTAPGRVWWNDAELLDRLVAEMLESKAEELRGEGYGEVIVGPVDHNKYSWRSGKAPAKSKRTAFVYINRAGEVCTEDRYTLDKPGKAKPAKNGTSGGASAEPSEPSSTMTKTAHEAMTLAGGAMVGRAVGADPHLAVAVVTAAMVRMLFDEHRWTGGLLRISAERAFSKVATPTLVSDMAWEERREYWRDRLAGAEDLEAELAAMPSSVLWELLAHCVGAQIRYSEFNGMGSGLTADRRQMATLGRLAKVDPATEWKPSADWLKGMSRDALEAACKELDIEPGKTKGQTAERVAIAAADKGWVPPYIRELVGAAEASEA